MCSTDCAACRTLRVALLELLAERDLNSLTIADVAARSGLAEEVSGHSCGELCECAVVAHDECCEELYTACELALLREGTWHERFQHTLEATVDLLATHPGMPRLCLVETDGAAVPALREHRAESRARFVALLARERARGDHSEPLPELHFELLAGAACRMLQDEFLAGRLEELRSAPAQLGRVVSVFEPVPA
jgi:hypothetical protein